MDRPSYGDAAPIVAIATPLSRSALAIVRTSGRDAADLAAKAFSRPETLRAAGGYTIVHGWILDAEGKRVDEVLASVFRAPHGIRRRMPWTLLPRRNHQRPRGPGRARGRGFREALPGEFPSAPS
jgi:tRNA modification GTPase